MKLKEILKLIYRANINSKACLHVNDCEGCIFYYISDCKKAFELAEKYNEYNVVGLKVVKETICISIENFDC